MAVQKGTRDSARRGVAIGLATYDWEALRRGDEKERPFMVGESVFVALEGTTYMYTGAEVLPPDEDEPDEVVDFYLKFDPVTK